MRLELNAFDYCLFREVIIKFSGFVGKGKGSTAMLTIISLIVLL